MSFDQYSVHPKCLTVLRDQKLTEPTAVQAEVLPAALEGQDVLVAAQTGTGKTLAFTLPSMTHLASLKPGAQHMLVLTPTRELAIQVHKVVEPFAKALRLNTVCLYGGAAMDPQVRMLRRGCDIVIATPGRLMDHMARRNTRFDQLAVLVLDEADRMLDMGFLPDVRKIVAALPKERQTMMFSATFPKAMEELAGEFLVEPLRIEVGNTAVPVQNIAQRVFAVHTEDKTKLLSTLLSGPEIKSAIIFSRTQHRTDRLAKQLEQMGFRADAIHGGRSQAQRQRTLDGFRRGKFNILAATDVASRGIDVQGISHVVNFDIPRSYDDYVHRIGRTARANAQGDAITFVCHQDLKELREIEKGLGAPIPREHWDGAIHLPGAEREKRATQPANRKNKPWTRNRPQAPRRPSQKTSNRRTNAA